MGKKLKDQPTSVLINAQQIIQHASQELHNFFGHIEKEHQQLHVSTSYYTKIEAELRHRVEENNRVMDEIEKELFSRIERDFPGSTTSLIMRRLVPAYEKEYDEFTKDQKKEGPAKEDKPVKKLETVKRSREKRV